MKTIPALLVKRILGKRSIAHLEIESPEMNMAPGLPAFSMIYAEDIFMLMFANEQKRAVRSGKPFDLMLIDISRLDSPGRVCISPVQIEYRLSEITRDHDCKGWYRTGRIIGIIFTEIKSAEKDEIGKRIIDDFNMLFDRELMERISISMHRIYGEGDKSGSRDGDAAWPPETLPHPENHLHQESFFQKRALDLLGAAVGIIMFSPLFLVLAILIKTTSKGPVLFRQERIGKNGKPFHMLKFRSMYTNNDDSAHRAYVSKLIRGEIDGDTGDDGRKIYKIQNDPRVTAIGRIIRKTSLDELPQLLNVLKGEMSLVGPRPALPSEVAQYEKWHLRRVSAMPGITGFWQVEGRSRTTFDTMVRMDISYIRRCSLLFDLFLIIKTPLSLFSSKGAF